MIKEKGSVDADLKRAKQKQLEYEQMNITEIIRRVEQKSAVTDELTRQQQRRQELTRAYDDVIAKYSALIERVDTDFRAFENAQHALVNEREYATNKQNESLMQTRRNEENEVYTRFEEKSQLSADKLQQLREEKSQQNNELLRIAHEDPYKEEHAKADEELNKLNTRAQELKMSIQQLSTQAVSLRQEAGMKLRELELAQAQPLANAQKEKQEIEEQILKNEQTIKDISDVKDSLQNEIRIYKTKEQQLSKEKDEQLKRTNEEIRQKIMQLEKLSHTKDELEKNLLTLRSENSNLKKREQAREEERKKIEESERLQNERLYDKFRSPAGREPTDTDWSKLFISVDKLYPNMAATLQKSISLNESERKICYLSKIGAKPGAIGTLLGKGNVSVYRKRLYKKLTDRQGTAKDFDKYISDI